MTLLLEHRGRTFHRLDVATPTDFVSPFGGRLYLGLFWLHDPLSADEGAALAERIVASNCRYALCVGPGAEELHDQLEQAVLAPFFRTAPGAVPPEIAPIFTPWYEEASSDEVGAEFVSIQTFEAGAPVSRFLVAHLGGTESVRAALDDAVRRAERATSAR